MTVQEKVCAFLILASFIEMYVACYSISLPYLDDGVTKKEVFKTANVWRHTDSLLEHDSFLINTPGCYIPNYMKTLKYNRTKTNNLKENICGTRAVFVENGVNNKIYFRIDDKAMKKYTFSKKYRCCYKFAYKSIMDGGAMGENHTMELMFTKCKKFKTGTIVPLSHEIIAVSCFPPRQKKKELYNDAYIKLRKLNVSRVYSNGDKPSWNVILLGLHAMSRARLFDTMPHTSDYLKKHNWLDYKGFQKIGSSTFPNLMPLLTGKNYSTIVANCASGLHKCAEHFIWNKFMASDYVTAYGEDFKNLPDTFAKYGGFRIRPTHHYMRPFFRQGEKRVGKVLCLKRQPSATHLLNYAHEFAHAYKNCRFFGMFWINSYSHEPSDDPSVLDRELTDWFIKLNATGVLRNTFVIFLSDHGKRFGDIKIPIESYFEERLPMLFILAPDDFKRIHRQKYTNMLVNQHRLITAFDLYVTLGDILKLTNSSVKRIVSEGCPRCSSLFKLKSIRWTCVDAHVSENGCSCRTMTTLDNGSTETERSIALAMDFINNVTHSVNTAPCTSCKGLTITSILRSHVFQIADRIYNVVAFEVSSKVRFEVTVVYRDKRKRVLYLHTLTAFNKNGNCVLDQSDRPYCDCERIPCEDNKQMDRN